MDLPVFQHARFEPFVNHAPYHTIFDPSVEEFPQLAMIDAPEVVGHVCINDVALALKTDFLEEYLQCLMLRFARTKSIRVR
jgi:hypothetical protein